jgi:hypothetical protein
MAKKYYFYAKNDWQQEPISSTYTDSRLTAAKVFAAIKKLSLKKFLSIYSVSK